MFRLVHWIDASKDHWLAFYESWKWFNFCVGLVYGVSRKSLLYRSHVTVNVASLTSISENQKRIMITLINLTIYDKIHDFRILSFTWNSEELEMG